MKTIYFLRYGWVNSQILKIETQFWWNPSIILRSTCIVTKLSSYTAFSIKKFNVQKHLRCFQETWEFSYFHLSHAVYTTQSVNQCYIIPFSPIFTFKKSIWSPEQIIGAHNACWPEYFGQYRIFVKASVLRIVYQNRTCPCKQLLKSSLYSYRGKISLHTFKTY